MEVLTKRPSNFELRKRKDGKRLELGFIHEEQTPKKRINHFEEIRIRFIVCLSFIKLNWWQAMDFAYYLFFLKRIEKWHVANLRRSSWTTGRIEKNERIKMIIKEKNLERTTIRILKWMMKENESPRRIRRNKYVRGDLDAKEQRDNELIKNTWTKHRDNREW